MNAYTNFKKIKDRIHGREQTPEIHIPRESKLKNTTSISANISQVLLLALGVFGYFYTVLPVFQLQSLQEKAAKLEIDNSTAQIQLNNLKSGREQINIEIEKLNSEVDSAKNTILILNDKITKTNEHEQKLKTKIEETTKQLNHEMHSLDQAHWDLVINDIEQNVGFLYSKHFVDRLNRMENTHEMIENTIRSWPNKYKLILEAVNLSSKQARQPAPRKYYEKIIHHINIAKQEDGSIREIEKLLPEYISDLNTLNNSLDEKTTIEIKKTKTSKWT